MILTLCLLALSADGRTENFILSCDGDAQAICQRAEVLRHDIAHSYFGRELPPWDQPCRIEFTPAAVYNGQAKVDARPRVIIIRGRPIINTTLSHEVGHHVVHSVFRPPIWIDEGLASLTEDNGWTRDRDILQRAIQDGRALGIADLMQRLDYPRDVHAFYVESTLLCEYLIEREGIEKFMEFARGGGSPAALRLYYGLTTKELKDAWMAHFYQQ